MTEPFALEPWAPARRRRRGIGGHQRTRGILEEWLTPRPFIEALGPFDLDPCAPVSRPWPTAAHHLTVREDGLREPWAWSSFVWLNPPYGPATPLWMERMQMHPGGGLALVFARTDTAWWHRSVWPHASAILFLEGRLNFCRPDGSASHFNAGGPSCLVAYGQEAVARLRRTPWPGVVVHLRPGFIA